MNFIKSLFDVVVVDWCYVVVIWYGCLCVYLVVDVGELFGWVEYYLFVVELGGDQLLVVVFFFDQYVDWYVYVVVVCGIGVVGVVG